MQVSPFSSKAHEEHDLTTISLSALYFFNLQYDKRRGISIQRIRTTIIIAVDIGTTSNVAVGKKVSVESILKESIEDEGNFQHSDTHEVAILPYRFFQKFLAIKVFDRSIETWIIALLSVLMPSH